MSIVRRLLPMLALAPVALAAALLATPTSRPATRPSSQPAELPAEATGPLSYFNANCANCHGNYGSYWGEGFAAEYDHAELREIVAEMAGGPGFAPIDGLALDVQTAYNARLAKGKDAPPFVVATRADDGFAGEVTPGSTVTLVTPTGQVQATVDGHRWTAPGADGVVEIVVTRGGKTTRVGWSAPLAFGFGAK